MTNSDLISGIGVTCILAAFFLSTFRLIRQETYLYYSLNIVGGVMACYGSILINSIPFMILEGIWAVVAIVGLIKHKPHKS